MAKINCPVCGNEIYSTDTKCVNCGSDNKTIEFELKKREFVSDGIIKDDKKRKKGIIIAIELILMVSAITAYIILFMPRVVDEVKKNKQVAKEYNCNQQSGDWNEDLNECILSE